MESFTLFELNQYIKRVFALNFEDPIWITAEINQIKESKGQYYLELVQNDDRSDQVIAKSSAVIWYKSVLFLKKKLNTLFDTMLQDGSEVRLKVTVDFHERFGLKLVIEDVDLNYTIGQLEVRRLQIIEQLKTEGYLRKNRETTLPNVCQTIAVISSATAAGYQDFINQLKQNPYGYHFNIALFESPMQGYKTRSGMIGALKKIQENQTMFDCVAILRGGGSKLDLSAFDDYEIAKEIALYPIPVICGIGHDIDQAVIDLTAHTSVKTPTAAADFFIERLLTFESRVLQTLSDIESGIGNRIQLENLRMQNIDAALENISIQKQQKERHRLEILENSIKEVTDRTLQNQLQLLQRLQSKIELINPQSILQRGYALVYQENKHIKSAKTVKTKTPLKIQFKDGVINK